MLLAFLATSLLFHIIVQIVAWRVFRTVAAVWWTVMVVGVAAIIVSVAPFLLWGDGGGNDGMIPRIGATFAAIGLLPAWLLSAAVKNGILE